MDKYEIIEESGGYALVHNKAGRYTVVGIRGEYGDQIYSVMPTDMPSDGGIYFANYNDAGIEFIVTNWYSRSYARRKFRKFVTEEGN